jgi:hypothetical protein
MVGVLAVLDHLKELHEPVNASAVLRRTASGASETAWIRDRLLG